MGILPASLHTKPEFIAMGRGGCSCVQLKAAFFSCCSPMGLMNSISIACQSQVIWESIPWMESMKGGVLDIWTCFFYSDVSDLFLLLEQARGRQ